MSKQQKRLLIVDDEPGIRRILQVAFEKEGFQVTVADCAETALEHVRESDCVLTDVTMPGMSGIELLGCVVREFPQLPVILMTAYGTIPQAVQAIRNGAFEYVTKPFDLGHLRKVVQASLQGAGSTAKPRSVAAATGDFEPIAESALMKEVLATARQVADSKATVMIGGESGVGKEVVANLLHKTSKRSSESFIAVSCAALPESLLESELFGHEKGAFTGAQAARPGRFEMANKGTLFLDEIGEIPLSVQVKLLRVLQERQIERLGSSKATHIDVRLVTATHRDLHAAVDEGTFRLDLLYRLQVVEIVIPPLRERQEDILPLANHFLARFAKAEGRPPLAIHHRVEMALLNYRWPGNVRELENVMERAMAFAGEATELTPHLLPRTLQNAA